MQLRAAPKILEGNDAFIVAAAGAGKSLIFVLVTIAARLLGIKQVVIVICPLKALQLDQVSYTASGYQPNLTSGGCRSAG